MSAVLHLELLESLTIEKAAAFADEIPDALKLRQIVQQLNALPSESKSYFAEFTKELRSDLFKNSIEIKGFDLDTEQEVQVDQKNEQDIVEEEIEVVNSHISFDELLLQFVTDIKTHLEILKGYFILKLENTNIEDYELLVLYDEKYFYQPLKKVLSKTESKAKFASIDEFNIEIASGTQVNKNLLCLLLLSHRSNDEDGLKKLGKDLSLIFDQFKNFDSCTIKDLNDLKGSFYLSSNVKDDFFEEITEVTRTFLSNGLLTNEEEKMVKKLFTDIPTPLLIYKVLKGGKSGAKVIEVIPKKVFANSFEKRFIVKYAVKDEERKIRVERDRFGKFIKGYNGFNEYESIHANTLTLEGLRYSYAISASEKESFSFSEILENKRNKFFSEKVKTVDKLFEINLFERWKDSMDEVTCAISHYYGEYVKPDKIADSLSIILNKSKDEILRDDLFVNFNKIWSHVIEINTKVCHGDLHSDNFFCDSNGIYLIDFGFTDVRHAILDHTSLECSVKFKHFPFYITERELNDIEEELCQESTFTLSHKFQSTKREDILDYLEVIRKIRYHSISLLRDKVSVHEYYISLFLMTFRQIRYEGMNQLYAYNAAHKLAQKLVKILGLS